MAKIKKPEHIDDNGNPSESGKTDIERLAEAQAQEGATEQEIREGEQPLQRPDQVTEADLVREQSEQGFVRRPLGDAVTPYTEEFVKEQGERLLEQEQRTNQRTDYLQRQTTIQQETDKLEGDHRKREQQENIDERWLDELTQSQAERDAAFRELERQKGDVPDAEQQLYKDTQGRTFTVPQRDFRRDYAKEEPRQKTYKPIDAKDLADKIVDIIFEYIKKDEYSPNWPRVMSSLGYAQQQLRRRWGEVAGGSKSKFAQRFDELTKRTLEQKLKQIEVNESMQPEKRGFEAEPRVAPKDPKLTEPEGFPLVAPQFQVPQQKGPEGSQPDDILGASKTEDGPPPPMAGEKPRGQMGDPLENVEIPGKNPI
jgi:hypothetical protein